MFADCFALFCVGFDFAWFRVCGGVVFLFVVGLWLVLVGCWFLIVVWFAWIGVACWFVVLGFECL